MQNYTTYIPNRQLVDANNSTLLVVVVYVILGIFLYFMWPTIMSNNQEYNAWVCANNGNKTDCTTPLSPEERLK